MKIKKRTIKKEKKEGFPIKGQRKMKTKKSEGKKNNSRSMKEKDQRTFRPDKFSAR